MKAWRLIDALYENNFEMLLSTKRPISMAVGNLCLKAFSARLAALTKENGRPIDPPGYITKLREQREAAKARREAAIAKSKGHANQDDEKSFVATDADTTRPDTNSISAEILDEAQMQHRPVVDQPANPDQGNTLTRDDAFLLSDALDDNSFANGAPMMNSDTDAILAEENWLDTSNGEVIDWAQWDDWLGNINPKSQNMNAGPW